MGCDVARQGAGLRDLHRDVRVALFVALAVVGFVTGLFGPVRLLPLDGMMIAGGFALTALELHGQRQDGHDALESADRVWEHRDREPA
jgi:hypothetical protein